MYPLRPSEDLVVEAVEGIDQWLTKHALARREKKYHAIRTGKIHIFWLRVILAEIKRLRKIEGEQESENH